MLIIVQLRLRGVAVVTAQEDGTAEFADSELLDRAASLGCVLFTQDIDLVREATRRQRAAVRFAGVIYAHQLRISVGRCVEELELLAQASEPEEWSNHLEYLPLG